MKKYHHCVKFTYPLSFQTRIPKVDQHTGGKLFLLRCPPENVNVMGFLLDAYQPLVAVITTNNSQNKIKQHYGSKFKFIYVLLPYDIQAKHNSMGSITTITNIHQKQYHSKILWQRKHEI